MYKKEMGKEWINRPVEDEPRVRGRIFTSEGLEGWVRVRYLPRRRDGGVEEVRGREHPLR